jgi:hypothetical protein
MDSLLFFFVLATSGSVGPEMQTDSPTAPYEAEFEEVVLRPLPDGGQAETRQLWKLYRDSKGRWRQESSETLDSGEKIRFALITDYKARRFIVLDLVAGQVMNEMTAAGARAYQRLSRLPTSDAVPAATVAHGDAPQVEDLGEKDLEGLRARGRRVTSATEVVEVWSSPTIDQPPLLVQTARPGEQRRQRLFNIRLGEPDAALFAVLDKP